MKVEDLNITDEDRQHVEQILGRFAAPKSDADVFYDVCFTICAPQTKFEYNRPTIDKLREQDFFGSDMPMWVLEEILTAVRFFRTKAARLVAAKGQMPQILRILRSHDSNHGKRTQIKSLVKGLGMKASSHFLRNQGATDLAIIDTHILKFLNEPEGKTPSDKRYLILEEAFGEIADSYGLSTAGLDVYLWKAFSGTEWDEFDY